MRLFLSFALDQPELPCDNKAIFISFLKKSLGQCNQGEFYDKYFSGIQMKDYTFSVILPNPIFKGDKITLGNNYMKLIFSSDDKNKTGLIFFQAFILMKQKRFPLPDGNAMTLKKIDLIGEKLITSSKVIFRTTVGGGLVVRDHDRERNRDRYLTVEDDGFYSKLYENLAIQAKTAGFSDEVAENIKFTPIQCKKVVVKQYHTYVDATIGIFSLEADPELLQYFYQAGAGGRRSMGYGLLDIIDDQKS